MLTQLLHHGSVSYQGGFWNLVTGQLVPMPIREPVQNDAPQRRLNNQTLAAPHGIRTHRQRSGQGLRA